MLLHLLQLFCTIVVVVAAAPSASISYPPLPPSSLPPSDATALLAFKSKADLNNTLLYTHNKTFHFCQWQGVTCNSQQKVVKFILQHQPLHGFFAPNTLTRLDQLRVLSLQNNHLSGPIPDLSALVNLKSIFLDHNTFSGSFPVSLSSLHRLRVLDFSHNNLSGNLPIWVSTSLDRLVYLRIESNRFNGSLPPLNQTTLTTFNVSSNNFSGAIPVTPTFLRFGSSSFLSNPALCGEIIHKECHPSPPFFGASPSGASAQSPAIVSGQSGELRGVGLQEPSPESKHKRRNTAVIIGFSSGAFVLIGSLVCFLVAVNRQKGPKKHQSTAGMGLTDGGGNAGLTAVMQIDEQENELEEKVKRVQGMHDVGKSGNLVFCAGEAHLYSLDQLMRASAELLGRGTMGTTYKAVLDNRLIVCVKRLDAGRLRSKDGFEQHMESVGGLRHPNLVPLRAYFQAREERLLVYDYQPNGSLFSLIHGSKSTRAKPLHWTSCLKIAEDVAQGLAYIHQAWRLVHGNLKSTNVLLGPDFEACVSDYCLKLLSINTNPSLTPTQEQDQEEDADAMAYKAPETRINSQPPTAKSDVYAFGVLLLELLTGKPPSQLEDLTGDHEDVVSLVRSARKEGSGEDGSSLEMLLEVAMNCRIRSAEQRPTMWQVLKMLQEIKESVLMEEEDGQDDDDDDDDDGSNLN